MSLTIFYGNGISNQAYCMHRIIFEKANKNPNERYLYLVPEQSRLQVEQELVSLHPQHVIGTIQVVSFTSLALEVLEELEIPLCNMLDDVGKSMILRRIGEEMKNDLVFGKNLARAGFVEEIKSAVNELAMSGIRAERANQILSDNALKKHTLLQQKLSDIFSIYNEFSKQLGEKYMTAEELLWMLVKYAPQSEKLKKSCIILYGFNSFKQYQYQVLEELMTTCRGMVLLTVLNNNDGNELFPMAKSCCNILSELAKKHNIRVRMGEPKGTREYNIAPEIKHLEKNLFHYPAGIYRKEPQNLSLFVAADPVEETQLILRKMLYLVREKNYRYSDMAVITGDLSIYAAPIADAFQKAGIPYFIDEKRSILGNPLAKLLESLLDVLEENMSYESVIGLLRNPLYPMDREKVDLLDNYLVAAGISGRKRWEKAWSWLPSNMTAERMNELNELRSQVYAMLLPLWEVWKDKKEGEKAYSVKVEEGIETLVHLLMDMEAEQKMEKKAEDFLQEGDFIRESEYRQAYPKVMALFEQIVQLMGEDELRPQILIDTLHSGFEGVKVGFIPVTFDRVVVGDIARTRIGKVKALFLIGANDKVLPRENDQGGILNDYDREALKEAGMELLPTAKEEAFFQQEYIYHTVTKPSEMLMVSYSECNRAGKEIRRAYLVGALEKMFPKLQLKQATDVLTGLNSLVHKEDGFSLLIGGLRAYLDGETDSWWKELYRFYSDDVEFQKRLSAVESGLFYSYRAQRLDKEIARRLFEVEKENHVTRLEQYAGCAYAHFLGYGLKLKPRREHKLMAADYGTIFHQAINGFFSRLKESGEDWRNLDSEKRLQMVEGSVKDAMEHYSSPVFESSARNRHAISRISRMTDRTIWALGEQWKEGGYENILQEYVFSERFGNAIHLPLKDGLELSLQGRIDRIDLGEKDGKIYVKVIDYKTGQTQFDLTKVYYGLQLQLMLYLDAVVEMEKKRNPGKEVIPAGIYYYNLKDPLVDGMEQSKEEQDNLRLKQLRMNGLTNSEEDSAMMIDPHGSVIKGLERKKDGNFKAAANIAGTKHFGLLQKYVREKAQDLADNMYVGNIESNPYEYEGRKPCDYCEYQSVCGFELRTQGCMYRRLEKLSKESIWEAIEQTEEKKEKENGSQLDSTTEEGN